jgi:biopolymer transport protein ExbB/TolQ
MLTRLAFRARKAKAITSGKPLVDFPLLFQGDVMATVFMGNSLWQLIAAADSMSKFVLLSLMGMSVVCWTIFLYKVILLRVKKAQLSRALAAIRSTNSVSELIALSTDLSKTLPGYILVQGLTYTRRLLDQRKTDLLSASEWEGVEQNIEQATDDVIVQEERYLPILFASAGVATLVGLFGTVWGLIHAFVRISEKQSADIATIAPGIAEALITTLCGLVVAIPAYLMFHYLSVQNKHTEYQLMQIVDRFRWLLKHHFVRQPTFMHDARYEPPIAHK